MNLPITLFEAPPAHAKLGASSSKVWLACTPSMRLSESMPDEESSYAKEGTYGHALFEHMMRNHLGLGTEPALINDIPGYAEFHSQELADAVEQAVGYAIARIEEARAVDPLAIVMFEQRVDFSPWVPEGFGTADMVIITKVYIEALDLKMGRGVHVDVRDNSQFRLYMLGALHDFGALYDIKRVIGTVLQPRQGNYASEELDVEELLRWGEEFVKPRAALAWEGKGEFVPGAHCTDGFCRARHVCAARAEANTALARSDFALAAPELMTNEQIAKVLEIGDQVSSWISEVQAHALKEAIAGRTFTGFKVVEGRSNRRITDQDAMAEALKAEGIPRAAIFEESMVGLGALEKVVGKKRLAEIAGHLIQKPPGKPVLVPITDKRDPIDPMAQAIADFS